MLTTPEVNEAKIWRPTSEERALWESDPEAALDRAIAQIRAEETPEAKAEREARHSRQAHEGAQMVFRIIARAVRALNPSLSWDARSSSVRRPRARRARRNIRRIRTRSGSRGSPGLGDSDSDPEPPRPTAVGSASRVM